MSAVLMFSFFWRSALSNDISTICETPILTFSSDFYGLPLEYYPSYLGDSFFDNDFLTEVDGLKILLVGLWFSQSIFNSLICTGFSSRGEGFLVDKSLLILTFDDLALDFEVIWPAIL
jgi:hypothetical protein